MSLRNVEEAFRTSDGANLSQGREGLSQVESYTAPLEKVLFICSKLKKRIRAAADVRNR